METCFSSGTDEGAFNISLRGMSFADNTFFLGDNVFVVKPLEAQLSTDGSKTKFQTLLPQMGKFESCDLAPSSSLWNPCGCRTSCSSLNSYQCPCYKGQSPA